MVLSIGEKMRKIIFLLLLTLILIITSSACTRYASTALPVTGTALQDPIESIYEKGGTETAQAAEAGATVETEEAEEAEGETAPTLEFPDTPTEEASADDTQAEEAVVTATATTQVVSTPEPETTPVEYALKEGEFPYCIARRFNVDIDQLLSSSGLSRGSTYSVGTVLTIPSNADSFQGPRALVAHPAQYTVVSGDTFYSIACKFGDISPQAIASANGMDADDTPTVGSVIQIP